MTIETITIAIEDIKVNLTIEDNGKYHCAAFESEEDLSEDTVLMCAESLRDELIDKAASLSSWIDLARGEDEVTEAPVCERNPRHMYPWLLAAAVIAGAVWGRVK